MKLDYSARSLILDLQTDAENICRVEIAPDQFKHRVPIEQIEIYYQDSFFFTKLPRTDWTGTKDALGRIIIRFNHAINTKELKIHCNYDDLDFLQCPINRAEFKNTPEKLVTVYQKIPARTETYTYDGMGNRTNEKILLRNEKSYDYTYYANSNRLKSNGRYTYEYDPNGNLIKKTSTDGKEVWEYSYDLLNQLEQVKKNGTVVSSYIYDPNGFRVEKIGSKGRIDYVPLLNGEVGYRKEFSANMEYSFIYVGGQHLARVNGIIGGDGKKFYYANDHEGNGLVVTDEAGNKVVERDFTPFGQRIDQAGHEGKFPDETEDGFTGKDWDEDIGLYYFNARWYDPEVGRFISEDSVSDSNNPNEYTYCNSNPISDIDPSGHLTISINYVGGISNLIGLSDPNLGQAISAFKAVLGVVDGIKWAGFIKKYTSMNSEQFKAYLKEQGIDYRFEEQNSNTTFTNSDGQKPLSISMFGSIVQKVLVGDQKLLAFQAMEGNITEFLKNNPGLSLAQVKGLFDAAVLSANNPWGFGKNEFRFEGSWAKLNSGLYSAEAVIMNEGMIMGVITDTSTLADSPYESVGTGVYDYVVGFHHRDRLSKETGAPVYTEIGQEPPKDPATSQNYTYYAGKDKDGNPIYNPISNWWNGTYKGLNITVPGRSGINSHAGFAMEKETKTGSQGCMVTWNEDYLTYMNLFNIGDMGKFIVVNPLSKK